MVSLIQSDNAHSKCHLGESSAFPGALKLAIVYKYCRWVNMKNMLYGYFYISFLGGSSCTSPARTVDKD